MHVFLETDRLILRRFTEDDVDNLCDLNSDPEVMLYINGGRPIPRAEIEHATCRTSCAYYERSGYGFYAAIEKVDWRVSGLVPLPAPRGHHRPTSRNSAIASRSRPGARASAPKARGR